MAFPVTLNGRTYTLADFEGTSYVDGFPDALEDFVTQAGDIYNDTSSTSETIGTGSKTFTVSSGKPYQEGTPLRIADANAPETNFLDCVVTSYSGTSLTVNAFGFAGSGTYSSWTVNIGGAKTVDGTLAVSQGGTGATSASGARTNLNVYSKSEANSRFLDVSGEASDVTMNGNVTIGDSSADSLQVNATATIDELVYDNSTSGLSATTVQAAIDEVDSNFDNLESSEVSYDNSTSGLSATTAQAAIDETADETGLALIQDGVDPAVARAVAYNDIGAPVAGGYFAGVIDTIAGTIDSQDDYQTGQRYALIVAPKELEGGLGSSPAPGLTTGDLEWDTTKGGGEAGCFTRWNGLDATNVIINKNDSRYQVHNFIEECRNQYPAPATTGGSEWYLPAMDELELLYRNFKPNYADNRTDTRTRNFPGSNPSGFNPSSDPTGSNYSNNPRVPEKTPALGFRETEAAAIDLERYWSTTDADEDGRAWIQAFTSSGAEGVQVAKDKDGTNNSVRPVRRVVL